MTGLSGLRLLLAAALIIGIIAIKLADAQPAQKCSSDRDCPKRQVCIMLSDNNSGSCQRAAQKGDVCTKNGFLKCDEGLTCDPVQQECVEKSQKCSRDRDCPGRQVCIMFGDTNSGSCQRGAKRGQFCSGSFKCEKGLVCDENEITCVDKTGGSTGK